MYADGVTLTLAVRIRIHIRYICIRSVYVIRYTHTYVASELYVIHILKRCHGLDRGTGEGGEGATLVTTVVATIVTTIVTTVVTVATPNIPCGNPGWRLIVCRWPDCIWVVLLYCFTCFPSRP